MRTLPYMHSQFPRVRIAAMEPDFANAPIISPYIVTDIISLITDKKIDIFKCHNIIFNIYTGA